MTLWFMFLPRSDYKQCTQGVWRSLLGENTNENFNFHRTVLEGYWELGARTGTRMTAARSTFPSLGLFSQTKTNFLENFEKLRKCWTKTQFRRWGSQWKCWIKSREWRICHMYRPETLIKYTHSTRVKFEVKRTNSENVWKIKDVWF